ncbi:MULTISPECIES: DUF5625 family protein [Photorhabdus]|uniref:Photorhabdus luminescens subsp. laumondii TTO1 complete genome segment 3/17 n=1 Tax=Photorhabdus laumondii subsp. laumondii (strain DSM 15139 / CIP 105565 / TT01) TaxID=243265 RepID=Q7N8S7_PHOLL|nr:MULTISPECIES: DUF5625 family protein [Photorhabdus]AWK40590.1 hypothetical protein A4R40_03160 [Photorhabdus laumondii subsp. laumondii]AXG41405.1 hypothetical protein PluDJC_03225 [Photorhabdus laumondii subsp. laumondii]AXG45930.1 hypothetical protein PluTT01m_03255 [Photorhabdus laumondii subsp. laumondii]MCC8390682.1 hypothetical protein [Photorhabdus laumondii]MCZ1250265.1 hypothetical protein [Photorhabdus laumondii subsp. laumondii]
MKVLQVYERFKNWQNIIIFMSCTLLIACSEPINIYRPIEVSHSDQSVKIDFEISKKGDYQFALLFATGRGFGEMQRRDKLFGSIDKDGVAIPVSLRVVKDGKVFFDEKINAVGSGWGRTFYYEERRVNTTVREIKTLSLPSGHYSAVITTLEDVPAFNDIQSFVQLIYFNPKI